MKLHNKHFLDRQNISTKISYGLMNHLFEKDIIKIFHKAVLTEDKAGVDYFFKWQDKEPRELGSYVRAQFKNREDKYQDIPVCRFQPFYGVDHKRTKVGRDYKALLNNMNDVYLTAVKPDGKNYSEILVIQSKKLLNYILEAEKEWFGDEEPWSYFNTTLCEKTSRWDKKLKTAKNGVQAWFKRTGSEVGAKINMYVPRQYADDVLKVALS